MNARVGYTSVYVRASKQIIYIDAQEKMMAFTCPFNTFGRDGERCTICPVGAYCAGGSAEPIALPWVLEIIQENIRQLLATGCMLGQQHLCKWLQRWELHFAHNVTMGVIE